MRKGMTLPEILIVCGLLGLMTTCLYSILIPGLRAWKRSDIKSDLQRNGLIAMKRISLELRSSDIESVKIFHNSYVDSVTKKTFTSDAISFISPVGRGDEIEYDPETGSILWQKYGIFYLDPPSHKLYLQEKYFNPPTDSPDDYQLSDYVPDTQNDRIVAKNITSLSFQAEPDPKKDGTILKNPITFEIDTKLMEHETRLQSGVSTIHNQE